MILAAIFISPGYLDYIFGKNHKGITLNLGGKYLYKFVEVDDKIELVDKHPNPLYLPNFWGSKIPLLSAIVGENGVGKTSILNLLRMPGAYCSYVLEEDEEYTIEKNSYKWDVLYYSAFLNIHQFGAEHENFRDLSKYSMMTDDTEFESSNLTPLLELHESENLKRLISFIRLQNLYNLLQGISLPPFNKIKIRINSFSISEHQTSMKFRPFFKAIEEKIDLEITNREQSELNRLGIKIKDLEVNPWLGNDIRLELTIVKGVMNKVRNILESTGNKYLAEGYIKNNYSVKSLEFKSITNSKEAFYWFLENAFVELKKGKKINFPVKEIKALTEILIDNIPNAEELDNWDEMNLQFTPALEVIDRYEKFLLAFKDNFNYDKKILLQFMPQQTLSSGEKGLYELFSGLHEANKRFVNGIHTDLGNFNKRKITSDNIILLLDEGDLGFHPEWKKKYINSIISIIPFIFPDKNIQIIITTHDPLTLSDFPRNNIIYLKKGEANTELHQVEGMLSFGANISSLLRNAFFIKDGLIGEFARNKIEEVITQLNNWIKAKEDKVEIAITPVRAEEIKSIIQIIDEPIIQQKLIEMYGLVFTEDSLDQQIEETENRLKELKAKRNQK